MFLRTRPVAFALCSSLWLTSCAGYYNDEVRAPSNAEIEAARQVAPRQALQPGVFHMQRVSSAPTVRQEPRIRLRKPSLPPFDVAYVNRDVESVILELANAAGESVIIPVGLKGRTITLMHSGANFQQMLDLVLAKTGYHYNYNDGIWAITRYPVRTYQLEIGQSDRQGGLKEEESDSTTTSSSSSDDDDNGELKTEYTDELWKQVDTTLTELINVGKVGLPTVVGGGTVTTPQPQSPMVDNVPGNVILAPPRLDGLDDLPTPTAMTTPAPVAAPATTLYQAPDEVAEPWYRLTRSAGMLTVRAAPEAHRLIEDYLEQLQANLQKQILLEVRIVAITRDKTTRRGADVDVNVQKELADTFGFAGASPVSLTGITGGFLSGSAFDGDMDFIIQNLGKLGDVYTLSSPSLLARNNQISKVAVTRQLGFVETSVQQTTTSTGDIAISQRTDTARFRDVGTTVAAIPFIGKNRVQLRLRLSIADKTGDVQIRTQVGATSPVVNNVPEIATNVIDQDMVLDYGRIYAIGGVVEANTSIDSSYIPGLQNIPVLSELARVAENSKRDTEFLVFLKASRG